MQSHNDYWDVHNAIIKEPGKVLSMLSMHLLQSENLAKLIGDAINTQSELQIIIHKHVNEGRKLYWQNFILSKKFLIPFGLIFAIIILGIKNPEIALQIFEKII